MKKPICKVVSDGKDMFVYYGGKRIAKRGHPGTPQAATWVSLEPGFVVLNNAELTEIIVELNGVRVH